MTVTFSLKSTVSVTTLPAPRSPLRGDATTESTVGNVSSTVTFSDTFTESACAVMVAVPFGRVTASAEGMVASHEPFALAVAV